MNNKIISILLIVVLLLSFSMPVLAKDKEYIIDEFEVLVDDELDEVNEIAADLADEYGVNVFFVHTNDQVLDYDVQKAFFKTDEYIALVLSEKYWDVFSSGAAAEVIDDDLEEILVEAYDNEDTYIAGILAYYDAAEEILEELPEQEEPQTKTEDNTDETVDEEKTESKNDEAVDEEKTESKNDEDDEQILRLVDEADLLSDSEEKKLLKKLDKTSEELSFDIIIMTLEDHYGEVESFTKDLYKDVYGKKRDGVILLISMAERDWCIVGNGEGAQIFPSSTIDKIGNAITGDLKDGDYADAFDLFVEKAVYHIDGERNGYPFNVGKSLLIAAAVGLVIALIVTAIFKAQLKSVRKQNAAQNYVKPGSMNITKSRDFFMYRTVSRSRRTDSSSSSSSGSQSSGSGKF